MKKLAIFLVAVAMISSDVSAKPTANGTVMGSSSYVGVRDVIYDDPAILTSIDVKNNNEIFVGAFVVFVPPDADDTLIREVDLSFGYSEKSWVILYSYLNIMNLNDSEGDINRFVLSFSPETKWGFTPQLSAYLDTDTKISRFSPFYQVGAKKDFSIFALPLTTGAMIGGDDEGLEYLRLSVDISIKSLGVGLRHQIGINETENCDWATVSFAF